MTDEQDQLPPDDDVIAVKFYCYRRNYEKIYSAAAQNGESRTEAINRAMAFYYEISAARPLNWIKWRDRDEKKHLLGDFEMTDNLEQLADFFYRAPDGREAIVLFNGEKRLAFIVTDIHLQGAPHNAVGFDSETLREIADRLDALNGDQS